MTEQPEFTADELAEARRILDMVPLSKTTTVEQVARLLRIARARTAQQETTR